MRSHPTANTHSLDSVSIVDLQQIAMSRGLHISECSNTINQQTVYWLSKPQRTLYTLNELKLLLLN